MRAVGRKPFLLAGLIALGIVCIGAAIVIVRGNRSSNGESFSKTWYLHSDTIPAPCFRGPRTYETGARGTSLVVLDLDGDGRPDLAATDFRGSVAVATNSGRGSFEQTRVFRTGRSPGSLAAGDLDGDQSPDLVTSNARGGTVSVLLNSGAGSFGPKTDYRVGQFPMSAMIGDVDGDGSLDIVVTKQVDSLLLLNRGDGTFRTGPPLSVGRIGALADLNGDGKLDLVSLGERTASVILGLGGARFAAGVPYRTGDNPVLAAGDLNGDGAVDLVTANYGSERGTGDTISVLLNKGDGTFRRHHDFTTGEYPKSVAIVDVTGDKKPDIVSTDEETADVSILKNVGRARFSKRLTYPYQELSQERLGAVGAVIASIADLNGDGEPDLVFNLSGQAAVLLNVPGPCRDTAYIE